MEPSKQNTIYPITQANNPSQEKFYSSKPHHRKNQYGKEKAIKIKRADITTNDESRYAQLNRKRRTSDARNGISTGVLLYNISAI